MYHDGLILRVLGKIHPEKNYHRFPNEYKNNLRSEVWKLSTQSAGIAIHFKTNSSTIGIFWQLEKFESKPYISHIGQNGGDWII